MPVVALEAHVCVLVMAGTRLLLATPRHARHGAGLVLPEARLQPGEPPADAACRALWEQVGVFHGGMSYPIATPFLLPRRGNGGGAGGRTTYRSWQLFMVPPPDPLPAGRVHRGLHWRFADVLPAELAPPFARALLLAQGRLRGRAVSCSPCGRMAASVTAQRTRPVPTSLTPVSLFPSRTA